jgi:hypothetical protein
MISPSIHSKEARRAYFLFDCWLGGSAATSPKETPDVGRHSGGD